MNIKLITAATLLVFGMGIAEAQDETDATQKGKVERAV